jgi:magnesium-transporting ATPase (P-type)
MRRFEEADARGETWLGLAGRPWPEAPFRPTLSGRAWRDLRWLGAASLEAPPAEGYPAICQTLTQAGIDVTILTERPLPVVRRVIATHGPTLRACAPRIMTGQGEGIATFPMVSAPPGQTTTTRSDVSHDSNEDLAQNLPSSETSAEAPPAPASGHDLPGAAGTSAGSLTRALLVRQLRERGKRVAVLGWRPADVPALAESHVGIALGPAAPQRVREASDAIIPDGSLQSLVRAIALGRTFFRNIRRYLVFQTVVNGFILGASLLGPLFGLGIPFTALQMLWGHFLLDSVAALALATESPDPDVLEGPPTDVTAPLFTWAMARQALIMGGWAVAGLLALMAGLARANLPGGQVASLHFSAFVFFILWLMWMARWSGSRTPHANRAWDNPWALGLLAGTMVAQMAFVQLGGRLFHTAPLSERSWLLLLAGTGLFAWAGAALTDRLTGRPSLVVGERIP